MEEHSYSVPFQLLHEKLDIRLTATTIEAFRKGGRVAAHVQSYINGGYTTLKEHMPPEHRAYAEWNPSRFINWAGKTGTATARLVEKLMTGRAYLEQAYKACMGIIHLSQHYEPERVEAAAERALQYNACSYRSMKAILAVGLDHQAKRENSGQMRLPLHQNIRGKEYYQ